MKYSTLLKLMRFWPPFLGSGISVKEFTPDYKRIVVQMKLRFWNQNYVGTHFGGSLYSMTDPFYMLMLIKLLGNKYTVWDKSASIRYKLPAQGIVNATFEITDDVLKKILADLEGSSKVEPEFHIPIVNSEGIVVAEVRKVIHIAKKKAK
ncbi:MAG: YiiD C-terminal domain-containing protein [Legionella sp.]|nr:YiiD C-terminal domain-containing protein [Legionella sp.]